MPASGWKTGFYRPGDGLFVEKPAMDWAEARADCFLLKLQGFQTYYYDPRYHTWFTFRE